MKFTLFQSIAARLVLSLLLCLAPVYVLFLYVVQSNSSAMMEEIDKSQNDRLSFFFHSLEQEFDRVYRSQKALAGDSSLLRLILNAPQWENYERIDAANELVEKLSFLLNSSRYMENAYMYLESFNWTLSAFSTPYTISAADWTEMVRLYRSEGSLIWWNDGLYFITVFSDQGVPLPPAVIAFQLSNKQILQDLGRFEGEPASGAMLYGNKGNWAISSGIAGDESLILQQLMEVSGRDSTGKGRTRLLGEPMLYSVFESEPFNFKLAAFTPESIVSQPQSRYRRWFIFMLGSSVVITALVFFVTNRLLHSPLRKLVLSFRKVERGEMDVQLSYRRSDEFGYLYSQFNRMVGELDRLIKDNYVQTLRSQKAELKQLQAQINPHFLYNVFFTLYQMVDAADYDKLKPYTRSLGDYFRFITRNSQDQVPLDQEVQFAAAYLGIQSIRFGDWIDMDMEELPAGYGNLPVPRLTMQPLLENAFKHGLEKLDRQGRLSVTFRPEQAQLVIMVEDNGAGMDEQQLLLLNGRLQQPMHAGESTGLINVHQRLQLAFGPSAGLVIESMKDAGTVVRIRIPFLKEGHDASVADRG